MPIKMIIMVKRKEGLTPEQFREGYEKSHSRMAVKYFGHLWTSYRRNYLLEGRRFEPDANGVVKGGPAEIGFDAISEYVLRDEAAAKQMMNITQEDYDLMKEDEGIWFDQVHCWSVTCDTVEEPGLG